jgi:deoxycytidylate deaminase
LVVSKGLKQEQADHLADIDEFEEEEYGQRVRDTFHLSDVFIRSFADATDKTELRRQLSRFHDLLFGDGIHTPSRDEYGMFTAYAAGLRSAQLARQVGAAILAEDGEVLSIGCNEVPKGGGGQYWEGDDLDGRDHAEVKGDSSDFMKRKVLSEILDVVLPDWRGHSEHEREANLTTWQNKLRGKRVMNLTEFGRAVHAEMEALMGAVRVGASVRGATLYVTTFPCHNCAKHIVSAGIKRVVFIEPYPKSLALDLHPDSIVMDEPGGFRETDKRVRFDAFVGIAPRRYIDFFAMTTRDGRSIRRKDETGKVQIAAPGLRLRSPEHSFQELESLEAKHAEELTTKGERANETGNAGGAADRA